MAIERTLTIIKPDAVARGAAGQIISRFEQAGLTILAAKLVHLTAAQSAGFYIVHKARPFYASLCAFMTQGPCLPMVLEGEAAIGRARELMGATDPAKADPNTIRKLHGANVGENAQLRAAGSTRRQRECAGQLRRMFELSKNRQRKPPRHSVDSARIKIASDHDRADARVNADCASQTDRGRV